MNTIQIAAKLYECRDAAKSLAKMQNKEFKEIVTPYIHILKEVMKMNNLEAIPALLKISETNTYQENGMAQLMFIAATAEFIEPSI